MNSGQRRRNERAQRVDVYMDAATEDFPPDGKGGTLAAQLKELLAQTAALSQTRAAHANKRRQGTEGREDARAALRRMVKLVWDTHKTITIDRPDTKGLFESPSKIKSDDALVTAARSYIDAAAPLAQLFAEYSLSAAFFNDLRAKADALQSYTSLQHAGASAGVDSTAAIEETLRQIDEVVERLHTVVTNKYRDDPARLAAWQSARHVERARRSKPQEADEAVPPPPANG